MVACNQAISELLMKCKQLTNETMMLKYILVCCSRELGQEKCSKKNEDTKCIVPHQITTVK